jgi:1-acyl-sn-glycerol-3-phosphate acyltransferase
VKKILDYLLGSIYILYFGILLVIFHPIQFIAYEIFGQKAHQKTVEWLNFWMVIGWYLTGSSISFSQKAQLPTDKTIIFISNHQSMFDIPGIIWFLRKNTPLFISKVELSKGIPSISYNLRVGKAALIKRNDPKQAIGEIIRFAKYIFDNNYSGVIFPEGTRSRTGKLKPFAVGGVATLLKKCPGADVVPIAIVNTGKFNPKGIFPLTSFTKMSWTTLTPIPTKGKTAEEIVAESEKQINDFLNNL